MSTLEDKRKFLIDRIIENVEGEYNPSMKCKICRDPTSENEDLCMRHQLSFKPFLVDKIHKKT